MFVLANRYLGMPDYGEGLMVHDSRYDKKADRIMEFVLETGNFGHNREKTASSSYMGGKLASTFRKLKDFGHHMRIFPIDSVQCEVLLLFRDRWNRRGDERGVDADVGY